MAKTLKRYFRDFADATMDMSKSMFGERVTDRVANIADKIRSGKVAAAGAIVGAVMKATRGKADAKRVREIVLERCA